MRAGVAIVTALAALGLLAAAAAPATPPAERAFQLRYSATIHNVPEGAGKVSIWLPYPTSDRNQEIRDVRVRSAYAATIHKDPLYGNSILYIDVEKPKERSVPVELDFTVRRREYVRRDFDANPSTAASGDDPTPMARWLQPDAL